MPCPSCHHEKTIHTRGVFHPICSLHCILCEGRDHHWMYNGCEDETGNPLMSCKHCDATRLISDDDFEDGEFLG